MSARSTVDRLALGLAIGASAMLLLVALATMADILLRWVLNSPIPGMTEICALMTAVVVAASFAMALARRGNVTIRLLGSWLGPRTSRVLDTFGALVTAVFFALMTWQYVRFSAELTEANEQSPILRWATAPWWWAVTAMIGVAAFVAVVMLVREARGEATEAEPE